LKKLLLSAVLLSGLAVLCLADSVTDLQAAANYDLRFSSATWIVNANGVVTTGQMGPGNNALVSKVAASVNGSTDISQLYPAMGISAPVTLTGTNMGSNKLKLVAAAPSLIGHPLTFYIGANVYSLSNVSSFSGTLNTVCSRLSKPLLDSFSTAAKNTAILGDTTASSIVLKGTSGGHPFTLTLSAVAPSGLGGGSVANFVDKVEMGSGPIVAGYRQFPTLVQGGQNATITVTMHKAVTTATAIAMSYSGTGFSAPATITIPAGATQASATMTTSPTNNFLFMTFRGTFGTYFAKSDVNNIVPMIAYFTFSAPGMTTPYGIPGGDKVTVTLNTVTPVSGSTVVTLYCNNANVVVPATVTMPSGSKAVSFVINVPYAPGGQDVSLTGSFPGQVLSARGSFFTSP